MNFGITIPKQGQQWYYADQVRNTIDWWADDQPCWLKATYHRLDGAHAILGLWHINANTSLHFTFPPERQWWTSEHDLLCLEPLYYQPNPVQ